MWFLVVSYLTLNCFCAPLHLKLAVYVSDLVPEIVIGDPGRFRQIITHLVGNSLKVRFYLQLLIFRFHLYASLTLDDCATSYLR